MKKLLPLFILLLLAPEVFGQAVAFGYDAAGNRTSRVIDLSPQNSSQSSSFEDIDSFYDDNLPQTRSTVREETPRYEDKLGERNVIIYPNPTRGMIRIEFQGYGEMDNARLLLYNIQGNLLLQENNVESSATLDLSSYPAGMYILILIEGSARSEWRIIKQ